MNRIINVAQLQLALADLMMRWSKESASIARTATGGVLRKRGEVLGECTEELHDVYNSYFHSADREQPDRQDLPS